MGKSQSSKKWSCYQNEQFFQSYDYWQLSKLILSNHVQQKIKLILNSPDFDMNMKKKQLENLQCPLFNQMDDNKKTEINEQELYIIFLFDCIRDDLIKIVMLRAYFATYKFQIKNAGALIKISIERILEQSDKSAKSLYLKYTLNTSRGLLENQQSAERAYFSMNNSNIFKPSHPFMTLQETKFTSYEKLICTKLKAIVKEVISSHSYRQALKVFLKDIGYSDQAQIMNQIISNIIDHFKVTVVQTHQLLGMVDEQWGILISIMSMIDAILSKHLKSRQEKKYQIYQEKIALQYPAKEQLKIVQNSNLDQEILLYPPANIEISKSQLQQFKNKYPQDMSDELAIKVIKQCIGFSLATVIHQLAHCIVRNLFGSYLFCSPRGISGEKISQFQAGYRFCAILFGNATGTYWQVDDDRQISDLLEVDRWKNRDIPVFKEQIQERKYQVLRCNEQGQGIFQLLMIHQKKVFKPFM